MSFWHKIRITMAVTLFELDEHISDLARQVQMESEQLTTMLADAGTSMEVIRDKQARVAGLVERKQLLDNQRADMAAKQRAKLKAEQGGGATMSTKMAAGLLYKGILEGSTETVPQMAYEQLGAKPAGNEDQGAGSHLLPTVLSNELLMEPQVTNPLRARMTVTNITGLRLPKLGFAADSLDFVAKDGATAKEVKLSGDMIEFGRHELPLRASVSESLLRSSPLDIEGAVSSGLQSHQAQKELQVIFAATPATGEEGMSLYAKDSNSKTLVKTVEGTTLLDAILAAAADLEDAYQPGACVVMRRQDYYAFIRTMVGHDNLFGRKPEDVIGYPVIFCDQATTPVVGNLSYLHLNYDGAPYADTDKDVTKRVRYFTLNAEYDIKVRMYAAFRLAAVKTTTSGT